MKLYYEEENTFKLYEGKMQDVLPTLEEKSIDSIVCDPPYEINFMQNGWDNSSVAFQKETWQHCFRVLKPGGKLLNFDANWYCHLSDETKKREFALTRENLKREGIYDYFVDGEGIDNDWMDDIARQMPLTYIVRPTWDICKLKDIGFREATAETEKVFEVLTPEEKENYKNSPMFMIEAVK